jgi:hypothetical protein
MINNFKFKPISSPIVDVTEEVIGNGYELIIPYAVFENCRFSAEMILCCPTGDFLKNQVMLHAWTITNNNQIVKKQTHILSNDWVEVNNFSQPSSIYWPDIQQSDIEDYKYDMLFVVQPMMGNELPELVLEFELMK